MKISTKGRYGLRAMIDLASCPDGEYVPLGSIAQRQKISLNYLEHSFSALKKAGLVIGLSGAQGGYKLAKKPSDIALKDVMDVLEGDLSVAGPPDGNSPYQDYIYKTVWEPVNQRIDTYIRNTTLQDILDTK